MGNLTIGKKLYMAFGALLALLIFISALAIVKMNSVAKEYEEVINTLCSIIPSSRIWTSMVCTPVLLMVIFTRLSFWALPDQAHRSDSGTLMVAFTSLPFSPMRAVLSFPWQEARSQM